MNRCIGYVLTATVVVVAVCPASADWQVWTITESRRVLRDDPADTGCTVKLGAARNEWESFQILMRSDIPVKGVNIEAGDLTGPGGSIMPAGDARLYRQHQFHLTTGTYRNDRFKPGWYPDPLIPFRHPTSREALTGARLAAVPFDLPADETHGFWVDVNVPSNAKAGLYRGRYKVIAQGGRVVEIPVELTVWDFELPRVSTLVTALGSPAERMRSYYRRRARDGNEPEPTDWTGVDAQCAQMLTEHRINATPPSGSLTLDIQDDGSFRLSAERIRALKQFIDRYHVNALEIPHPDGVVKDPEQERAKLHAWLAGWDRAAAELARPGVVLFIYLKDEPNTEEDYKYVQRWGRAIREAKSVVKVMVVEQPWTGKGGADSAWGDLYGAVDIWCPLFSLFRAESAAQRQALGETIWTYTALCQGEPTPWWHIDYPLLNYRAPAWISWRYRIRGLLYWGGMSYWNAVEDPWNSGETYRDGNLIFNGEGTLVYPAHAIGYDGIASSLRLKALRDGIEDYEYLAILERLGLAAEAEKVVLPLAGSWFQWEKDPSAYEKARARLAEMIVAAKKSSSAKTVQATGTLRTHPTNPHYFQDSQGRDVVLIGDYTWGTFSEADYDFATMFDTLKAHGLNFNRVWLFWGYETDSGDRTNVVPCLRTGPGNANDGKAKYDLTQFDPSFFERLRTLCIAARERGIHLQLILFDAWMLKHPHLWKLHAFHRENNINGVDGDPRNTGMGTDGEGGFCSVGNPKALEAQQAFIRRVVDAVNEFDHVLFEIANENYYNKPWELRLCDFIHDYEKTKPRQHLVMPKDLLNHSSVVQTWDVKAVHAALIEKRSRHQPLIFDTDWTITQNDDEVRKAMWAAVLSGGHFNYMDDSLQIGSEHKGDLQGSRRANLRKQIGCLAVFMRQMRFCQMQPDDTLVKEGNAFAMGSSNELAAYLPSGGSITLDLSGLAGRLEASWFDPLGGAWGEKFTVQGGRPEKFTAPNANDWTLFLHK